MCNPCISRFFASIALANSSFIVSVSVLTRRKSTAFVTMASGSRAPMLALNASICRTSVGVPSIDFLAGIYRGSESVQQSSYYWLCFTKFGLTVQCSVRICTYHSNLPGRYLDV